MASSSPSSQGHTGEPSVPTRPHNQQLLALSPPSPSHHTRTLSSPPLSPIRGSDVNATQHPYQPATGNSKLPITPPTSPPQTKSSTNLAGTVTQRHVPHLDTQHPTHELDSDVPGDPAPEGGCGSLELIECPFEVEIVKDADGRDRVFGHGAWSTVYRGVGREARNPTSAMLPTPPSSPVAFVPLIVAVKTPSRKEAKPIIRNEGIVLSHIARTAGADQFVIPFYGFLPSTESLVLGPVPLSLHDYIASCTRQAQQSTTTWPSSNPVIGSTAAWLSLAEHTITALAWLHTETDGGAVVVHGDIKPANILLAPKPPHHAGGSSSTSSDFPFTPLLADFSSSQLLSPSSTTITPNTLSAMTREYTAPELLSSKVLNDPNSVATTASDVFSLAVTLLVAATGALAVYPSASMWQRQAMATQGWDVLYHVRNGGGEEANRVPRGGVVERVLERAVRKHEPGARGGGGGGERIRAEDWAALVRRVRLGQEGEGEEAAEEKNA